MIFSHGLGGSRNAYSHIVGSIASHGVIVIAPEHRDGSTPISYIRDVPSSDTKNEKSQVKMSKKTVDYARYSHTPSPEVEAGRNAQLKVRLWEMGLIHDSLVKIDSGYKLTNLNTSSTSLDQFKELMDVHTPGKITFAGHSFGAATVTQLVKSAFYAPKTSTAPADYEPLFTPSSRSSITTQITSKTPVILLDVWCLPLRAATTRWLWDQPFPCYTEGGAGGASLLAVESQAFYKWRAHLKATKRLLSPDPSSLVYDYKNGTPKPNFFYAATSAHLSQSDFGVLFPWVGKRFLAIEDPERIVRLNVRAVMQMMRENGLQVGKTSHTDMELEDPNAKDTTDDKLILSTKDEVRAWHWLSTDVKDLGDVDDETEAKGEAESGADAAPSQPVVGGQLMKEKSGTTERL